MKIESITKTTDYPYLNLFAVSYSDTNGRNKTWHFASRNDPPKCGSGHFDRPDAVVMVPYHTEKNKLVIIREFRVPLADYQYGFPAGLVDDGETVEMSVHRELREETGLSVTRIHRISPPVYSSSGMTDESISMVYVACEGEMSNQWNADSEDITPLLVSPDEAGRLCADKNAKIDVKTWLVLSAFSETGKVL